MALRAAIDTNRITDLLRGDAELSDWLGRCEQLFVPLFVLAEIKAGFLGGSRPHQNEALLRRFLDKPNVTLLLPDHDTAEGYAHLWVQLRHGGQPIPAHDIWIAALALQHNLVLVTRDRHFAAIPQLVLA